MELEEDGFLSFLDVILKKKDNQPLGHQVYRKPINTSRFPIVNCHRYPRQKREILNALVYKAEMLSDKQRLEAEIQHFKDTSQQRAAISKILRIPVQAT
ncbi:hypothetical protein Trydic_g11637 [Trypoxylus dichotomus]